jgi:hypothetical protein
MENGSVSMRWSITGDRQDLRDIAVDFLEGEDPALDALHERAAKVLVRAAEIVVTYNAPSTEEWLVEAFSMRHPDVTVRATWRSDDSTETTIVSAGKPVP